MPIPPEVARFDSQLEPRDLGSPRLGPSVAARVTRFQADMATRIDATVWSAIHAFGAHRWREGWETDPERGWSRYRGSRCTICDEPWEGW
jgi:hypothetical protein